MPELKQPALLVDLAVERLAICFSHHCLALVVKEALDDLRRDVEMIRNYVVSHVPRYLYTRFQVKLLYIIRDTNAPRTHKLTISKIMMSARLVGFEGEFVCHPDPWEAHRVTRVRARVQSECAISRDFELFDLCNLMAFKMWHTCTDAYLELIAQNCPKLGKIDVSHSRNVTDTGLRALSRCSNLRRVMYSGCSVSIQGIDCLFSVNGEIREMIAWSDMQGFDISDPSIHPAIECLNCNGASDISNRYLNSIVGKFPNLTSLIIHNSGISGDVYTLSELGKLSRLDLFSDNSVDWMNLRSLLRSVGSNIEELKVPITSQSDINSIYELCGNVTSLTLSDLSRNRIVIPPFKNLTNLECYRLEHEQGVVEFGRMPQLQELSILGFDMESDIESSIVDHERFPKLGEIWIEENPNSNVIERLRHIAKTNNLDLTVNVFY